MGRPKTLGESILGVIKEYEGCRFTLYAVSELDNVIVWQDQDLCHAENLYTLIEDYIDDPLARCERSGDNVYLLVNTRGWSSVGSIGAPPEI